MNPRAAEDDPAPERAPHAARLFVSFLDHELLAFHRVDLRLPKRRAKAALALRAALMACGEFAALPASSYYETAAARELVNAVPQFVEAQWIRLLGRGRNAGEFVFHKQAQYAYERGRHPVYFEGARSKSDEALEALWIPKRSSTTGAIVSSFIEAVELGDALVREMTTQAKDAAALERALLRAPEALRGAAFISDFIADFVAAEARGSFGHPAQARALERLIAQDYLRSNLADLDGTAVTEVGLFGDDLVPSGVRRLPVASWLTLLGNLGLRDFLVRASSEELFALRIAMEWAPAADLLADRAHEGRFRAIEAERLQRAGFGLQRVEQAKTLSEARRLLDRVIQTMADLEQDLIETVLERSGSVALNLIRSNVKIGELTAIGGDQINIVGGGAMTHSETEAPPPASRPPDDELECGPKAADSGDAIDADDASNPGADAAAREAEEGATRIRRTAAWPGPHQQRDASRRRRVQAAPRLPRAACAMARARPGASSTASPG